ncbi:MAG: transcriptional regulator [Rhodospirillales bacterium]
MALTREFKQTVKARVDRDPAFRQALFAEAVGLMMEGDVATGKALLRDYINATVGFEKLANDVGTPSKSLMRMFSKTGNPRADRLFSVVSHLQRMTNVHLAVRPDA